MEFIVQLFRALASPNRIRILRLLAVLGETTVSDIARATGLELSLTSAHLRALAAAGLVWRRRSGRRIGYRLAERAGNPVTAAALGVLRRVFQPVAAADPKGVAFADREDSATCSDEALFACFTAFTHPRRLQIIRHLARLGPATRDELAWSLSMSRRACLRHVAKLERRGFIRRRRQGRRVTCALVRGSGSAQRALLRTVSEYLAPAAEDAIVEQV